MAKDFSYLLVIGLMVVPVPTIHRVPTTTAHHGFYRGSTSSTHASSSNHVLHTLPSDLYRGDDRRPDFGGGVAVGTGTGTGGGRRVTPPENNCRAQQNSSEKEIITLDDSPSPMKMPAIEILDTPGSEGQIMAPLVMQQTMAPYRLYDGEEQAMLESTVTDISRRVGARIRERIFNGTIEESAQALPLYHSYNAQRSTAESILGDLITMKQRRGEELPDSQEALRTIEFLLPSQNNADHESKKAN